MERKRHKRKNNHVVIVTSDAANAGVRQFRIRPWILQTIILILCVIIGALIGYFVYEKDIWEAELNHAASRNEAIDALEQEKAGLEGQIETLNGQIDDLNTQIAELNEDIKILSNTVDQKVQAEEELAGKLEQQFLPSKFPLNSGASMDTPPEGEMICVFNVQSGALVVATANGTVISVNDDPVYGHNVWVDHGNGYVTIYRNQGEVKVEQGKTVTQGTTLMLITDSDSKLGYQIMKDGEYVDPMEMLNISG
ncbi:hypothetical protein D7X48_00495 [bacterium D16-50]|jgi:septal ring factor EnvC (AmiA/AmiB activator)|nr:peptidoglycan DD-metalloendopeptidase family protein [Lachnospiraceae bacterium]RKJ22091.1 hypothetical protein D7X48_00495 [bacterium D16-50]